MEPIYPQRLRKTCRHYKGLEVFFCTEAKIFTEGIDKRVQSGRSHPVAGIAQLVEHVICNLGVAGSNPAAGTSFPKIFSLFALS
jgi:hypothetical protein